MLANDLEEELEEETSLPAENCLYINGPIDANSISPAIAFIIGANAANEYEDIFVFINSPGGSLIEGFALANVIYASKIPITTVALGECDSSGLVIAMSGHRRLIAPDTSVLSHQYSAGVGMSKHADIQSRMKEFRMTADKVLNHYVKCTGLSCDDVKEHLVKDVDVYLSAQEAVDFNLFDEIFLDFAQIFSYNEDSEETVLNESTVENL